MSLSQFVVMLGMYDEDYVGTEEYAQLPTNYPRSLTPSLVFRNLCGGYQFSLGQPKGYLLE